MGTLVDEHYITREDLLRDGHLVADDQRESTLVSQFMQRPGAVGCGGAPQTIYAKQASATGGGTISNRAVTTNYAANPAPTYAANPAPTYAATPVQTYTGNSGLRATERASYSASGGGTLTSAQQHGGGVNGETPELLEVSILHASNLHHQNMVGDHWYVTCEIKRRNGKRANPHAGKITTNTIDKNLEPVWNELHHLEGWVQGDDLEFTVCDKGLFGSKTQGKVTLPHENFYPNGWEGEVPLEDTYGAPGALLGVRVLPMQR
jgi:hypothetical protein